MTILDTIEKKHYVATEHDVEQLAASHFNSDVLTKRSDGQYLRILVAAMKSQFGNGRSARRKLSPADTETYRAFLTETHGKLYAAVLRGVTTPDCADDEVLAADERRQRAAVRNGRAGFARSSASTLQSFLKAGGDVRTLDVNTVTKGALRAAVAATKEPDIAPEATAAGAALRRLERDIGALVEVNHDAGRELVEEAMERLQAILDQLDTEAPQPLPLPEARAPAPRMPRGGFRPSETTVQRARARVQ
jgi:hypothetical protein